MIHTKATPGSKVGEFNSRLRACEELLAQSSPAQLELEIIARKLARAKAMGQNIEQIAPEFGLRLGSALSLLAEAEPYPADFEAAQAYELQTTRLAHLLPQFKKQHAEVQVLQRQLQREEVALSYELEQARKRLQDAEAALRRGPRARAGEHIRSAFVPDWAIEEAQRQLNFEYNLAQRALVELIGEPEPPAPSPPAPPWDPKHAERNFMELLEGHTKAQENRPDWTQYWKEHRP